MHESEEQAEIVFGGFVCHVANEELGHGSCSSSVECSHALKCM